MPSNPSMATSPPHRLLTSPHIHRARLPPRPGPPILPRCRHPTAAFLPPLAALSLPPSQSQPAQPPSSQPLNQLPAPPQQWHGAEDSMRTWLQAKAEENKRCQEEERTAQDSLRLEQRRIEHDIIRTSLSGGIPPHLIPLVFAGMGGGSLPSAGLEWAQRYVAQEQQQLQQQLPPPQQQLAHPLAAAQLSPTMRMRKDRQISHPYGHSTHPAPAPLPSTPIASLSQQSPLAQGKGYPASPPRTGTQLPGFSALAQTAQSGGFPRLNTGEVQILQPQPWVSQAQSQQQTQPSEPSSQQTPGIYFHHRQPPTSQAPSLPSTQPATLYGK
mgnify:CR=1 FL=1